MRETSRYARGVKADRPPLAEALRRARLARFTNQKDAAAHVRAETGVVGLTDSQWASYESGDPRRPFQQKHRDAIEQVFGPLSVEVSATGAGQPADVSALLAMVQGLITTIDSERAEWREERRALWARLDRILPGGATSGGSPDDAPDEGDVFESSGLTEAGRLAAELAHDEMAGEGAPDPAASLRPSAVPRTPAGRTKR